MIVGFKSEETRRVFYGLVSRWLPADIQSAARRKLRVLDAAVALADLRTPPGNRLEARKGSRAGQHSICINDRSVANPLCVAGGRAGRKQAKRQCRRNAGRHKRQRGQRRNCRLSLK